jgi:hypothetical protein
VWAVDGMYTAPGYESFDLRAASANGRVVVGVGLMAGGLYRHLLVWGSGSLTPTHVVQNISGDPTTDFSTGSGIKVSGDGSLVAGPVLVGSQVRAFVWSIENGASLLHDTIPGVTTSGRPVGISANGKHIVVSSGNSDVRWYSLPSSRPDSGCGDYY